MRNIIKINAWQLLMLFMLLWTSETKAYDYAYNGLYFNIDVATSTATLTYKSTSYGSYSNSIIIPEKFVGPKEIEYIVTAIGENAFRGCYNMTSVSIPNTVTTIGNNAFYYCSGIATLSLPNMIDDIGEGAFRGCSNLTKLELPPFVTNIKAYTFDGCTSLSSVTIPSGVTSIGNYAFHSCTNLPRVTLPQALLSIGENAFSECTSLSAITLPGKLTTIGAYAFYKTSALLSITIPSSVNSIGERAFENSALQTLTYADGCETALRTWATKLLSVTLPNSLKTIAPQAFYNCKDLTTIPLPEALTTIGNSAFEGCSSLTALTLPASVTSIGSNAYTNSGVAYLEYANGTVTALRTYATKLTSVSISASVKRFAPDIFAGCNLLENVFIADLEMWNYIFKQQTSDPLPVAHKLFLNGNLLTALNADFGCDISNYAFCRCKGLRQVNITSSVTGIQNYAFMQCPDLEAVAIGSGVAFLGVNAFQGCTSLSSVRLGTGVKTIGKNAFNGCNSLNSLLMGGNEQSIGEAAFQGCSKLPVVKLPSTLSSIGASAFRECYELQEVLIPAGITQIQDYTFYDCRQLQRLQVGEAVSSIGSYAFSNCHRLTTVHIPNATMSIAQEAFNTCDSLRYVFLGTGITSIGSYAFANCKRLVGLYCESIEVPSCNSNAFNNSDPQFINLYVPDESVENYKSQSPWKSFGSVTGLASAPKFVNSITLSDKVLVEEEGVAAAITATVHPEDATNKNINWTSSNTDIVYINKTGNVLTNAEGIATIRATAADGNGAAASCLVIVANNFKAVTGVNVSASRLTLPEGKESHLSATTAPSTATYREVVWTSSNPLVAQVSNVGLVTALSVGTATITCSAADGKGASATCLVEVTAPIDPTIGDATEDGYVSVADLTYVISVILERIEQGEDISLYDVDGDGQITVEDAMAIIDIILGYNREPVVRLLELSADNMTVGVGDTLRLGRTVIPYRWNEKLTWSSSDDYVVTVSDDGVIVAHHAGSAYITVEANDGSDATAQCLVTVDGSRGSTDGHAWVDLGLPSGTRWATANVGALTEQEYGSYYAWGENAPKDNYNWANYQHCDGSATGLTKYCTAASQGTRDDKTTLESVDDAATAVWGSNWCMPTAEQFEELINPNYTTSTWTQQNGLYGRLITSRQNGNSIFLPAAGYMKDGSLSSSGTGGYYATSSLYEDDCDYNHSLNFGSSSVTMSQTYRCYGQSIRPVGSATIVVSPSSVRMEVGETANLQAKMHTPSGDTTANVRWSSSNVDVATVDRNGRVKAISNGTAVIYATTEDGLMGSCRVMVGLVVYEDWTSTNAGQPSSSSSHTWVVEGLPGMYVSFDWKVSSESGYDKLTVKVNDYVILNGVSGEQSGTCVYTIPGTGTYNFTATYSKDGSGDTGEDMAQITNFVALFKEGINPSDITELSYLHFDGGYLVTDVYMKSSISFQMKIRPIKDGGGAFVGNGRISDSQDYRLFMYNGSTYIDAMSKRTSGRVLSFYQDYELEFGNYYLKDLNTGTTLLSGTPQTFDYTGNNDALIYVCSSGSSSSSIQSSEDKAYLYYLKVYDGQNLIRDYVPCRLNALGVLGLYDKLNKTFTPTVGNVTAGKTSDVSTGGTFVVNGVSFKMMVVEGGTFQMGSESGDSNEMPVHQVTLSSFSIGETEVTQELWEAVMGSNPSDFKGAKLPVEQVSWNDCQTFITKLNQLTGQTFRLPTEAEWEYAARGGNQSMGYTYAGSNTLDEVAWYWSSNSSSMTHDVATKSPNELGLYDMSGNVWEWCQDWYGSYSSSAQTNPTGPSTGSRRVNRGGGWTGNAGNCRVSTRSNYSPTYTGIILGLRLAL